MLDIYVLFIYYLIIFEVFLNLENNYNLNDICNILKFYKIKFVMVWKLC